MDKDKRRYWGFALIIALLQLGFISVFFSDWGYDDAYITFRYAENLNGGLGFVYNPEEKVLSTTTPLFTLLLTIIRFITSNLPHAAVMIGAICLPIGGLFLWDFQNTCNKPLTAWSSLLIYPIFPLLLNTLSSEIPLFLALCLGSMALYAHAHNTLAALLLAFATLTRPEGVIVALLLLVDFIIAKRKAPARSVFLIYVLVCAPWLVFAFIYFGSPIPVTLAAKQAQGSMAISQGFVTGLLTLISRGYASRWQYWILSFLSILGMLQILRSRDRKDWILPSWAIFHFFSLSLLGMTSYFWYYAPIIPSFIVLSIYGLEIFLARLQKWFTLQAYKSKILNFSSILLLTLMIGIHASEQSQFPDQRLRIYRAVGEWLHNHTEPEASVGSLEVGIIGYYAQRTMVDFAGIIQPAIAEKLTSITTYQDSMIWAIQTYHPNVLVVDSSQNPALLSDGIDAQCGTEVIFEGLHYGYRGDFLIVRCEW